MKKSIIDFVVIKIRVLEFFKMSLYWLIDLALLYGAIYMINNKESFLQIYLFENIDLIIVPLLISLFVTLLMEFIKIYNKRCLWAEKRDSVYRDLLEIFTIIIVSMHKDFGNLLEPPHFRGLYSFEEANSWLNELYQFADDENDFDTYNFYLHKLEKQIRYLSNEYLSIISNACTDEDIKYYFTVLITNLIKYKDDIIQLNNKPFRNIAKENAYMQIKNISQEMWYLYKRMYKILKNKIESKKHIRKKYDKNYYFQSMFGGINNNEK